VSTCVRRVAVVAKHLNVPYELVLLDWGKGDHKAPEFLEKQPFGQIPYVEDEDGTGLFESRAIGRYLVYKYGKNSGLIPPISDLKAYTKFEIGASVEQADFDPSASAIVFEKVFKAWGGESADEERVKSLLETLNSKLDGYERILAKQKYIGGDTLTLADLFHLPYAYMLDENVKSDVLRTRPNVARWWKEISVLPAWQAVKDGA